MGTQNKGWGCGFSNGEGLSRYLAENASPVLTAAGASPDLPGSAQATRTG